MKKVIVILAMLCGVLVSFSQTIIAKQSFETSGDTWSPLSYSTPPCTSGASVWNTTTGLFSITSASDGNRFWGARDLNGTCGGNGYESIIFPAVNVSANSEVIFSFDYYASNLDDNEDIRYELFYDGISQGIITAFAGSGGNNGDTNGWRTETVAIPANVNTVSVELSTRNTYWRDEAGFDNVQLFERAIDNSGCAEAQALTVGTNNSQNVVTASNVGATTSSEVPTPTCGGYQGNDVWFTATVPASGTLTVETQNSTIDPAIAIYSGTCGNFTLIDCNDDINVNNNNLEAMLEITATPNSTVYIRVWSYLNRSQGNFNIVAYSPVVANNDDCAQAQELTVGSTNTENVVTGDNTGATNSSVGITPTCGNYQGGDVWYSAVIPNSSVLIIETSDAGGIQNTAFELYTGNCGSLSQQLCNSNGNTGNFSRLAVTGPVGTRLYIRVWEPGNNDFGAFNIVAYSPDCPFTTTWNGSSWNSGTPNQFTSVIIDGNYDTNTNGSFDSCNCTINAGNTVNIRSNDYISIENDLTVNGTLEIRHQGSLVMVDDNGQVTNSGTINTYKTTTPVNLYDYTYWSSPVTNSSLGAALPTSPTQYMYQFDTPAFSDVSPKDKFDDNGDDWKPFSSTATMNPGKGYIAMAPLTGSFPQTQTANFSGTVNTGIITQSVQLSGNAADTGDDWNLIGNPYPSGLDADAFLNANSAIGNTVYLWTHNTEVSPSNSGPDSKNYATNDYAIYTPGTGGTAAGSGGARPTGIIASGQGFFVEANNAGNITFNNSMRVKTGNNQFFKLTDQKEEKDRVWLNLYNDQGAFNQILIGFIDGATNNIDDGFDARRIASRNVVGFYSLVDNTELAIQAFEPLVSNEKIIPLGYNSTIKESVNLKITIDEIEGELLQDEYDILLKDNLLNITHDLKLNDYEFLVGKAGYFNNRFELVFVNKDIVVLNVEDVTGINSELSVVQNNNTLNVESTNIVTKFKIYDLLGRLLVNTKPNKNKFEISNQFNQGSVLIVNAELENGKKLSKKIVIR